MASKFVDGDVDGDVGNRSTIWLQPYTVFCSCNMRLSFSMQITTRNDYRYTKTLTLQNPINCVIFVAGIPHGTACTEMYYFLRITLLYVEIVTDVDDSNPMKFDINFVSCN